MILAGGTGYVQVCDGFTNKKIKELILEIEEAHYDLYEAEFKAGKFSISVLRLVTLRDEHAAWGSASEMHREPHVEITWLDHVIGSRWSLGSQVWSKWSKWSTNHEGLYKQIVFPRI